MVEAARRANYGGMAIRRSDRLRLERKSSERIHRTTRSCSDLQHQGSEGGTGSATSLERSIRPCLSSRNATGRWADWDSVGVRWGQQVPQRRNRHTCWRSDEFKCRLGPDHRGRGPEWAAVPGKGKEMGCLWVLGRLFDGATVSHHSQRCAELLGDCWIYSIRSI